MHLGITIRVFSFPLFLMHPRGERRGTHMFTTTFAKEHHYKRGRIVYPVCIQAFKHSSKACIEMGFGGVPWPSMSGPSKHWGVSLIVRTSRSPRAFSSPITRYFISPPRRPISPSTPLLHDSTITSTNSTIFKAGDLWQYQHEANEVMPLFSHGAIHAARAIDMSQKSGVAFLALFVKIPRTPWVRKSSFRGNVRRLRCFLRSLSDLRDRIDRIGKN